MEMKAPLSSSRLSPDSSSDPEEKEVSDEDDDDRNHKHRRRGTRSQSGETDAEPAYGRSNRKRHKPFENGTASRQKELHGTVDWRSSMMPGLEKDDIGRFDKRRHGPSRGQLDFNQRGRLNQTIHGEPGPGPGPGGGRGRGMDYVPWNQRDFRFNQLDAVSQMVQQGSLNPNLLGAMGIPTIANPRPVSWNGFGLVPGISNTGLDSLHPLPFQSTLRPTVNPALNGGIRRPRCKDFEEQGFCLRGDMCPMEHGVNRIVVEDVQSLSQFDLPVPLPSGQLFGTMNPRSNYGKNDKVLNDVNLGRNGTYSRADLYDPDVPLWNEEDPENLNTLSDLPSLKNDDTDPLSGAAADHTRPNENHDNKILPICAAGSSNTNSSVLSRNCGSKQRSDGYNLQASNSVATETEHREDSHLVGLSNALRQGQKVAPENGSRKANRTLFVLGIPQKSNRKEILIAHFQKFGQIIHIHIPKNSEKAFVQFSKREEAEEALKSPDAVMGNRFIKVLWANRDNLPHENTTAKEADSMNQAQIHKTKHNYSPFSDVKHSQKKLELEHLMDQLRKKQELLEQKRNDFKRQLNKFEKQKTEAEVDGGKPDSSSSGVVKKSSQKRYKLDNRPTSFTILSPLPSALGNVDALTRYFSSFGELTSVELQNSELQNSKNGNGFVTRIRFATRHSAEKAFQNGKYWNGTTMHFSWITSHDDDNPQTIN